MASRLLAFGPRARIAAVAAVAVVAFAVGLVATGSAAPRTVHTRTANIGAAAFGPVVNTCQYGFAGLGGGDDPGILSDDNQCSYVAPVTLPQGAQITRMELDYDSHVAGTRGLLELTRHLTDGGGNDLAHVVSLPGCSAPCAKATTVIAHPTVDNATFTYALRLFLGAPATAPGFDLMRVVITYNIGH